MVFIAFGIVLKCIRDDFRPHAQKRLLLILAGVLLGIVAAFLVLPEEFWVKVITGLLVGLFLGGGMVFSLPRQWNNIKVRMLRRTKPQQ
jgi:uncharacterized membrane protein YccC